MAQVYDSNWAKTCSELLFWLAAGFRDVRVLIRDVLFSADDDDSGDDDAHMGWSSAASRSDGGFQILQFHDESLGWLSVSRHFGSNELGVELDSS
jgi:hypothetical protein